MMSTPRTRPDAVSFDLVPASAPGLADGPNRSDDAGLPAEPDEAARLNSCFHLLGRVEDQVRFADSKAGFVATVQTLLVGPLIYNIAFLRAAIQNWDRASRTVLVALAACYGLLFLLAMILVGLAVVPRLRRKPSRSDPTGSSHPPSRLFFGRIAREFGDNPSRFVAHLATMSDGDWLEELGVYVVDASRIAAAKHRHVRHATILTVLSVLAWCAVILALLFLGQA